MQRMSGREGGVVLTNGVALPAINATAGQLERWRILNASPSRFYELSLKGHRFVVLGVDGGRLAAASQVETIGLVPGERVEVLVSPATPGDYALETLAVDRGTAGMGMTIPISGAASIARFTVSGTPAVPASTSVPLPAMENLSTLTPQASRELTFSMQGMNFRIDGREFDAARIDIRPRFDTLEEWTVRNSSTMDHPFHLHVWPFQVVASSSGLVPSGWKDVVNVPAGGWVRFRVRFDGLTGKTVFHCHILDHEDLGMMGVVEVA